MSLVKEIKQKSLELRKSKAKRNPYIMLLSRLDRARPSLKVESIDKISDEEVSKAVRQEIKSIEQEYSFSGDKELNLDIQLLSLLLPTYITPDEMEALISAELEKGVSEGQNMGQLMKLGMVSLNGVSYEKKDLATLVKNKLK